MSLQFSYLSVYDGKKFCMGAYESGHPDEYDARELIAADEYFSKMVNALGDRANIMIDHYDFDTGTGKDELAEESHFALIRAYDEMVQGTNCCEFIYRDDVEYGDHICFPWKEDDDT